MVQEITYTLVSRINDSWEHIRRVKNYKRTAGTILFRRFLEKDNAIASVFGFDTATLSSEEFWKGRKFLRHAQYFIEMIEKGLGMLGPDQEMLTELLTDLGQKHLRFGVKSDYYPLLCRALIETLKELLGEKFTEDDEDAWVEVYYALSSDMISGSRRTSSSIVRSSTSVGATREIRVVLDDSY